MAAIRDYEQRMSCHNLTEIHVYCIKYLVGPLIWGVLQGILSFSAENTPTSLGGGMNRQAIDYATYTSPAFLDRMLSLEAGKFWFPAS